MAAGSKAVYVKDGTREVVQVIKAYGGGEEGGAGYVIFIPSLGREREVLLHSIDTSAAGLEQAEVFQLGKVTASPGSPMAAAVTATSSAPHEASPSGKHERPRESYENEMYI